MYRGEDKAERHKAVIGIITGLIKKLARLAPHPSRADYSGPLFIQSSSHHNMPGEQDSMLGQIFMESLIGPVFTEAANNNSDSTTDNMNLRDIADYASEYLKDRASPDTGEGKGSFALCKHRAIADGFNFNAFPSLLQTTVMEAFRADLPERLRIEKALSFFDRQLLEPAIS